MDRRLVTFTLAASLASALAPAAARAADKEKCYGVALKGQNDCAAGSHDCAGHATISYDKQSFKLLPAGTCTTIKTPQGNGMLMPGKA